MSTGNSHPRNSSDERRPYNDPNVASVTPDAPDPRRDPDQPRPQSGHPLDRELASYRRMLPGLFRKYPGQWVIIKEETGVLIRPTYEEALKAGYEHFGLDGFLVKQILEHEPVLRGSVAWLAERDYLAGEVERLNAEVRELRGALNLRDEKTVGGIDQERLSECHGCGRVVRFGNLRMDGFDNLCPTCYAKQMPDASTFASADERDSSRSEVARLKAEAETLRADNAKLADSLASANERMTLLQDIREAQAASIAKYRAEVDRLGCTIGSIKAALATGAGKESTKS